MDKRFEVVYEQGIDYLWMTEVSCSGLTLLLDGSGHVIVTEEERQW